MKQNNSEAKTAKGKPKVREAGTLTVGMDLGDKTSRYCWLNDCGEICKEGTTSTTKRGIAQLFGALRRSRIAIEAGTHSPWISRLLKSFGHEVIVANPRELQLISASSRKDDRLDAQKLARLARIDPQLLAPVRHRSEQAQADLMLIRVRATLVDARTALINSARGMAKAMGERLPACDTDQMGVARLDELPEQLRETLEPLLRMAETHTEQIKECDTKIEQIARTRYPETALLKQVNGVGTLIALTFVLTVEDPHRFKKSRDVGCYVGLRPKRRESGDSQPQLRITKEGDRYLRRMLVQAAHCILGRRGPDTDLKRWGLQMAERGGKNAKKRAVVAVARKLAVLLHSLWVSAEVYEPLRNNQARASQRERAA